MLRRNPPTRSDNGGAAPRWINPLLAAAALFALAATLLTLWAGQRNNPHRHGMIADITVDLGGQPVREHCTTCHVAGGMPRMGDQGWSSAVHPDIAPHLPERLGCTGCHLGEGMALDRTISHGLPGLGARKVLSGSEVQGRCYACHPLAPLEGAQPAWSGYELFRRKACDLCHPVDGSSVGTGFGPDLSAVGSQLGLVQLEEAIREPRLEPVNSIMPRYPLSRSQSRDLAYFLKSRDARPLTTSPMWIAAGRLDLPPVPMVPEGVDGQGGEGLLWRGGCLACHRFGSEDGRIGPDLTPIGAMRNNDYLATFLEHPARLVPGATMPISPLEEGERRQLVAYLSGSGSEYTVPAMPRKTYMQLCQRCHAANGDGRGLIQPNLAQFPRAFSGNAEFFRRMGDERLRRSVDQGIPGTSMPPYEKLLSEADREALLDLIFRAFIGIDREAKIDLPPVPERPGRPSPQFGRALYMEHCVRCHGRTGTGKGPEYLEYLPRPRNLTNTPYFAALEDQRILRAILDGVPGTAMPAWRESLDSDEAWALVWEVRRLSGGVR